MIKTKGLSKSYIKKEVLNGINFEAKAGEIVGLFGANGSGKTTFLKCVAGLASYRGEVLLDGRSPVKDCSVLKEVGVMVDIPSFYKGITGRENIKFFCEDLSLLEKYIKVLKADDFIDKKVKTYSVGMRQKLGILLACVKGRKLVLLDEPFNGLDVLSLDSVDELLNICKGNGACIVLTSHMLEHSGVLCNRYYLLKDGKVVSNECQSVSEKKRYKVEMKNKTSVDEIAFRYADKVCKTIANTFEIVFENEEDRREFLSMLLDYDVLSVRDITDTIEEKYRLMEQKNETR